MLLCASPAAAWNCGTRSRPRSTNPEIRQAVRQQLATQEERDQAQGLWYPRVSVEGSAGVRNLRNPTRARSAWPTNALSDRRRDHRRPAAVDTAAAIAEIRRQASRTDAAAARSRSARSSSRSTSRAPISTMSSSSGWWRSPRTMRPSTSGWSATSRRRLQGLDQHRRPAAGRRAPAVGARPRDRGPRGSRDGGDQFRTLTGDADRQRDDAARPVAMHAGDFRTPRRWPRQNNPRVQEAIADLETAASRSARRSPSSGRASTLKGRPRSATTSTASAAGPPTLRAAVVLRWTLFNGGIKEANVREQQAAPTRRMPRLFERTRRAEEDTRSAWNRLKNQEPAGRRARNAEPRGGRPAAVLPRAVQRRPPVAARRARRAEHPLQRAGAGRDRAACPSSTRNIGCSPPTA